MRKILAFGLIVVAISLCLAEEEQQKENVKNQEDDFKPFWYPNSQLDPEFAGFGILSKHKFKPNPDFTLRPPYDVFSTKVKREAVDEKYKVPVDPLFDPTRTVPSQLDPGFALKPRYDILSDKSTGKPDPDFTLRPPPDTSSSKGKREAVDEKYKVPVDPLFDPTRTVPSQLDPGFALKPRYDILSDKSTGKPDPDFTLRPPPDTSSSKVKREAVDEKYKVPVDPLFDPTRTVPSQLDPGFALKPQYDILSDKSTGKPDPDFTLTPDTSSSKVKREAVDEKYKVPVDPLFDPTRTIANHLDPDFALKPQYDILSDKSTGKPDPDFTLRPPPDTSSSKVKREAVDEKYKVPVDPLFDPTRTVPGQLDPGFALKPRYDILSDKSTGKPDPDFTLRPPPDTSSSKVKRVAVDEKYKVPVDPFFDPTRTVPSQLDPGFALKPRYDILSDKSTGKPDPDFTLRPPPDTSSSKVKREAVDEKYKVPVDPFFDATRTIPSQIDPGFARKPPYDVSSFEKFTSKPDPGFTLRPPPDTSSSKVKREAVDEKYKVPVDPFFDATRTIPSQIDPGFARKPPYDVSSFEKFTSKPDPGFILRPPHDAPSTKVKREAVDEKYKVPVDPFFDPRNSSFEKFTSKPDPGFTLRP